MKFVSAFTSLVFASVLVGSGCGGSDADQSDGAAVDGGQSGDASSGGSGATSASGGSGDASATGGSSTTGGAAATGGSRGSDTGGAGSGTGGSGGSGGAEPCTNDARRCSDEQPQRCVDGVFQNEGAVCAVPLSCDDATGTCRTTSLPITGGEFLRSYDTQEGTYDNDSYPASVSDFSLDKYEVTVGQFRKFAQAVIDGYRPDAGSGKHTHLNGGLGLTNGGMSGGNEQGWDSDWNAELPSTEGEWTTALACSEAASWTPEPGSNEARPINCVTWFDAYAYCIWDGGFLPSEAEWNYASAGGDEQRPFPWGSESPSSSRVVANVSSAANVGSKPAGDGLFGHSDLSGNVSEWVLDWDIDDVMTIDFYEYPLPCTDCAQLEPGGVSHRVMRGSSFSASFVVGMHRSGFHSATTPDTRTSGRGIRCARTPN